MRGKPALDPQYRQIPPGCYIIAILWPHGEFAVEQLKSLVTVNGINEYHAAMNIVLIVVLSFTRANHNSFTGSLHLNSTFSVQFSHRQPGKTSCA